VKGKSKKERIGDTRMNAACDRDRNKVPELASREIGMSKEEGGD